MYDLSVILIELFSLMTIFLLIFIYSTISSDQIISFMVFLIYLILLIPFSMIIENLNLILNTKSLSDMIILNSIFYCCILINIIIGIFLFIELIYLFIFN